MKDHICLLQGLLRAILKDCANTYPHLTHEFERDLSSLLTQIESRGLVVLTIELPDLGKHFDKCLSQGQFVPSGLPNGRLVSRKHQYQRLFSGLMKLIFDDRGCLKEVADPTAVFLIQQLCYGFKKVRLDCSPHYLYKAIEEFYSNEESLPVPSILWRSDNVPNYRSYRGIAFSDATKGDLFTQSSFDWSKFTSRSDDPLSTLQQVADRVAASLGEFIPSFGRYKHGPGAVSEKFKESKFEFASWTRRLDRVFPFQEFGFPTLGMALHSLSSSGECDSLNQEEPSSKLIAVPKTMKGPRLIASEPISHQYAQQGIRDYLVEHIGESLIGKSVTIKDQNPSRAMALAASGDGKSITVDLKSASDRLSCWFVERLFRSNYSLLSALQACRTLSLTNDIDKKHPSKHYVKTFAMMGSAVTFPVQSIAYFCIAVTAILVTRGMTVSDRSIRQVASQVVVYGDDIIAPKDSGSMLLNLLESMWFKVNYTKTHTEGNFRESCGMVAFAGVDVTPAYVLEPFLESRPSSISSVVEASNNFFSKGLWESASYLESTIPKKWRELLPTVRMGDGAFGLKSFCGSDISMLKSRWNDNLQRTECRTASVRTEADLTQPEGQHVLYQWFTDGPGPDFVWVPGHVRRLTQKIGKLWKCSTAFA